MIFLKIDLNYYNDEATKNAINLNKLGESRVQRM